MTVSPYKQTNKQTNANICIARSGGRGNANCIAWEGRVGGQGNAGSLLDRDERLGPFLQWKGKGSHPGRWRAPAFIFFAVMQGQ